MPDRLALPDDRREACRACGSTKRRYMTECAACGKQICSSCSVMTLPGNWPDVELCEKHALDELNQRLEALIPVCTCKWPAWSRYGQQLPLEAA